MKDLFSGHYVEMESAIIGRDLVRVQVVPIGRSNSAIEFFVKPEDVAALMQINRDGVTRSY